MIPKYTPTPSYCALWLLDISVQPPWSSSPFPVDHESEQCSVHCGMQRISKFAACLEFFMERSGLNMTLTTLPQMVWLAPRFSKASSALVILRWTSTELIGTNIMGGWLRKSFSSVWESLLFFGLLAPFLLLLLFPLLLLLFWNDFLLSKSATLTKVSATAQITQVGESLRFYFRICTSSPTVNRCAGNRTSCDDFSVAVMRDDNCTTVRP